MYEIFLPISLFHVLLYSQIKLKNLDTSAWLKLYLKEDELELVKKTVTESELICTHLIVYTEIRSALARAERENRIESFHKMTIIVAMEKDRLILNIVQPVETLIRRAGLLCDQIGLRVFNCIHLAVAEAISLQTMSQTTLFASFDAISTKPLLH